MIRICQIRIHNTGGGGGGDPAASDKTSVNSPLRAGQPVDICVGLKLEERRSWLIAHDIPTVATVFSSMGLDQHCCQLTFFLLVNSQEYRCRKSVWGGWMDESSTRLMVSNRNKNNSKRIRAEHFAYSVSDSAVMIQKSKKCCVFLT